MIRDQGEHHGRERHHPRGEQGGLPGLASSASSSRWAAAGWVIPGMRHLARTGPGPAVRRT